ncbi:MAG: 50S ribosomal protein L35 [Acidobacteriota bacterium]
MPKMKTHRGAAKRFRRTGGGKLARRRAYASHNLGHKSRKRKRRLRQATLVADADVRRISRLLSRD